MAFDQEFAHWLVGLADAIAIFGIARVRSRGDPPRSWPKFRFELSLRATDRALLEEVHDRLGIGTLFLTRGMGPPHSPQIWIKFSVHRLEDCLQVVTLFRRFPLRSRRRQWFAVWARAVEEMAKGDARSDGVIEHCVDELSRLRRLGSAPDDRSRGPGSPARTKAPSDYGERPSCRCGCGRPTKLFSSNVGIPHPDNPDFRSFIMGHHARTEDRPRCLCGCGQLTSLARHPASRPHPDDPNYCSFIRDHASRVRHHAGRR